MRIVVTGSSGLLGSSLQKIVGQDASNTHEFVFLSRKDCDLLDAKAVDECFATLKPDIVVHCASSVGGVYDNMNKNYRYLVDNTRLNLNVVDACKKHKVKRLVNILSTCIFPDQGVIHPLTFDQLHNGLPHHSNIGYAFSKRMLHLASKLATHDDTLEVVNLVPTNLYGENDNYNLKAAHVIPALIHKTFLAKTNGETLTVLGSGNAKRQFLFVDDLSKIILHFVQTEMLEKQEISCVISPPLSSEVSIHDVVDEICHVFQYNAPVRFDLTFPDGQHKKTTNDNDVLRYIPEFKFTPFRKGLATTIEYFLKNYETLRT
jgi:GDP-L-fucose synthase